MPTFTSNDFNTPAVVAENTATAGDAISAVGGVALRAKCTSGAGNIAIIAEAGQGQQAVFASGGSEFDGDVECHGSIEASEGLVGGNSTGGDAVHGHSSTGNGVAGSSDTGPGVSGTSKQGDGTRGATASSAKNGVVGGNSGVAAIPVGVPGGNGVFGFSSVPGGSGVFGSHDGPNSAGVAGFNSVGVGVRGTTDTGVAVEGASQGRGLAGNFSGNVNVTGDLNADVINVTRNVIAHDVIISGGD
jgi:hypothetical protein